jgi:RNA polymerase sigma factor (sigma-70 family)
MGIDMVDLSALARPSTSDVVGVGKMGMGGKLLDDRDLVVDSDLESDSDLDSDSDSDLDSESGLELDFESAPLRPIASADELQLQTWLARIVRQDEAALDALYRSCIGRVYGLALRIVGNPAIAEEVAEDTFWQVWRQAPRFEPLRGTALAWMLTITRSRALDALRVQRRIMANTVSTDALGDTLEAQCETSDHVEHSCDPHDLLEATQSNAQLHCALAQLDALPRQLLALAFFKGLTHDEIVGQTGLPLGTVKSHIRRAMVVLRKYLTSPAGLSSSPEML